MSGASLVIASSQVNPWMPLVGGGVGGGAIGQGWAPDPSGEHLLGPAPPTRPPSCLPPAAILLVQLKYLLGINVPRSGQLHKQLHLIWQHIGEARCVSMAVYLVRIGAGLSAGSSSCPCPLAPHLCHLLWGWGCMGVHAAAMR